MQEPRPDRLIENLKRTAAALAWLMLVLAIGVIVKAQVAPHLFLIIELSIGFLNSIDTPTSKRWGELHMSIEKRNLDTSIECDFFDRFWAYVDTIDICPRCPA
jgi:hypothetical protein